MLGTFVLSTGFYDAYFSKAQRVRRMLVNKAAGIFNDFDALIMPTSPTTAFAFGHDQEDPVTLYLADIYTVFANLAGLPGMAVPLFKHSNGMPFGLQVMTKQEDDVTLLRIAKQLSEKHCMRQE
jgi:aspartyl-tRNA(Asn)/glutamyl-tRNA(Gln) amidotransferase subunit A